MPCKAEHKTQEVNCSVLSERVFSAEWSGHFFAVLQMMCDIAKLYWVLQCQVSQRSMSLTE